MRVIIHIALGVVATVLLAVLITGAVWLRAEQQDVSAPQTVTNPPPVAAAEAPSATNGAPAETGGTSSPPTVVGQVPTDDDLVTAARVVRVRQEVAGDLAAAGSDVTIDGPVNGYVMSAGRRLTLVGQIGNDLWAAGETVNVESPIVNNAMVAGRTVHLRSNARVGHDAHLAGNTVTAEGRIERNLTIGAGGIARIGANVGGVVTARATRVQVLPDAVIQGDLFVRAARPPEISPQARVMGQIHYERTLDTESWLLWPQRWIITGVALLILGLVAVWFSPGWAAHVAATMRTRAGASILSGLAAIVLIPIAIALLAVTVIGFPLAVVLTAIYILALAMSSVLVSYRTGEWLLHRLWRSRWAFMILGVAIVSLGMSLPSIGWAVALLVLITGVGALMLERTGRRPGTMTAA
jgi:hypothetical protein